MSDEKPAEGAARLLREAAAELDRAARHALVAADHIDARLAPRMAAHVLATQGHLVNARERLDAAAQLHARMAQLPDET